MRVVLDTNVVVSGVLKTQSKPSAILRLAITSEFTALTSIYLQTELKRVLGYQKINSELRLTWGETALQDFLSELKEVMEFISHDPPETQWVPHDPDDNWVIACAIAGQADYIVTGDQHLLALNAVESVRILSPAEFLGILENLPYSLRS